MVLLLADDDLPERTALRWFLEKVVAFGTRPELCAEALAAGPDAFVSK